MAQTDDPRTLENACAVIIGTLNEGRLIESVELEGVASDNSWREYTLLGRLPDSDIKFTAHMEIW